MAIDWGLAPKPLDYLTSLQSFDLGRTRAIKDQDYRRTLAVRDAKTQLWRDTHPDATMTPPPRQTTPVSVSASTIDRGTNAISLVPTAPAPTSSSPSYVSGLIATGGAAQPVPARGSPGAAALNRIAQVDPDEAMKMEGDNLKLTKEKLDTYQAVNAASLQLMGGVHDQATYDAAKARAHAIHDQYGVGPDALALPDQYDPKVVEGLMMQALKTGDQLAAMRASKKLDWELQDGQIDNARADRSVNSEIDHRRAQEGLTARGQNLTDSRGRYGIGVASSDRRRGQDVSATTSRRGQDISSTDRRRGQDLVASRPRGARAGEQVASDRKGNHVVFRGGAWVPVK